MTDTKTASGRHQRRLANYLLDARFQLKYTGMVVLVTLFVGGLLGYLAIVRSSEQHQLIVMQSPPPGSEAAFNQMVESSERQERNFQTMVITGIGVLVLALGLVGIVITHRIVGPAYRIRRLLEAVGDGHYKVEVKLRKSDELHDVFEAFEHMLSSLRARQQEEIDELSGIIESGATPERLAALRDKMKAALS